MLIRIQVKSYRVETGHQAGDKSEKINANVQTEEARIQPLLLCSHITEEERPSQCWQMCQINREDLYKTQIS